jgi:hypothetical protein
LLVRFRSRDAARPLIERLVAGDHIVRVSPEELTADTQQVRRCRFAHSLVRLIVRSFVCFCLLVFFGSFSVFCFLASAVRAPRCRWSALLSVGRQRAHTRGAAEPTWCGAC